MRHLSLLFLSVALLSGGLFSCKKWVDPVSTEHPQISNPYCNDPAAVNYNWGFPGKPDNSVCFYPSDLFAGSYTFKDTVTKAISQLFLSAHTFEITISKLSKTQIGIDGLCTSGQRLLVSAGVAYMATVDTTVGDSLTEFPGQFLCRQQDTVTGTFVRDKIDSSLIYVTLYVRSDTGATYHRGRAIKK